MSFFCIIFFNKTNSSIKKITLADKDRLSQILCITLQGTCFDEHTDLALYSIPGYTLISDAYLISSHCGVAIYLNNYFSHEITFINSTSTVFESVTIEIWKMTQLSVNT